MCRKKVNARAPRDSGLPEAQLLVLQRAAMVVKAIDPEVWQDIVNCRVDC
jgi:hypothetical protein